MRYLCPPDCGRPPMGAAVATNPRFTAPDGAFSVSYPGGQALYQVSTDDRGVTAKYLGGDTGTLQLFSQPAANRSPQDIATSLVARTYPNAHIAYEIPNAMVGYQHGYGEIADSFPQGASSSYQHLRLAVLVAVKNDLGIGGLRGRALPPVRPRFRSRATIGCEPGDRSGHGQVRQQFRLAW